MSLSGDLVVFIDAENASPKWGVPLYVWLCQNFKVRDGAIAIILLMLPNVLLQILLWVLYLALYVWPEKENAPVLA